MAKGKQRPPQYNRQSKGYQQNLYKQQLKEQDVKMPKQVNLEKFTKINKIGGAIWLIIAVVLWIAFSWKPAVAVLALGIVYLIGFMIYVDRYMKSFIKAYKQMGVPKDMYIKQLRKGGTDVKSIERMSRTWDKVKVD